MDQVEQLSLNLPDIRDDQAQAASCVRAVARAPRLCSLELQVRAYTANLDEALAECVRLGQELSDLTIDIYDDGSKPMYTAPALFAALQTNYKIQKRDVPVDDDDDSGGDDDGDDDVDDDDSGSGGDEGNVDASCKCLMDKDTVKEINTLLRLNKAGRGYVEHESTNATKAVAVLERVNDCLDCLFVHLRESSFVRGLQQDQALMPSDTIESRKRQKVCCIF